MSVKLHTSKAWLQKRFIEEGKTVKEIAEEAKVTEMTIRRALEKLGLK